MTERILLGVVGSLRTASINAVTARAAQGLLTPDTTLTLFDPAPIPLYNGDLERAGLPEPVAELQARMGEADGVVFFSPEYNGSFPAVTKNIIDWLSRPPGAWEGKAFTMVVSTPGGRAGMSVRQHFEAILAFRPVRVFPTLGIGNYGDRTDAGGNLTDQQTLTELAAHLAQFARFASESDQELDPGAGATA